MWRLLDWRLARLGRRYGLPDIPEVRRFYREAWLDGFTFGRRGRQVAEAKAQALTAAAAYSSASPATKRNDSP